jgi:Arc/MetJ family transcription regulator
LDDALIEEAVKLGNHKTKREAVTEALISYNRHLRQLEILELFGGVEFDESYDYKAQRQRS